MFGGEPHYPCAVTSPDPDGLEEGIRWCLDLMQNGDTLTLWVPFKSSLGHSVRLQHLAHRSDVELMTGIGVQFVHRRGPVLAAGPRMDDIGEIQRSSYRVTG